MADRIKHTYPNTNCKKRVGAESGSWQHRKNRSQQQQNFNAPAGLLPQRDGVPRVFDKRNSVPKINTSPVSPIVPNLIAGRAITVCGADGSEYEGTVVKTIQGYGYAVMTPAGNRRRVAVSQVSIPR